MLANYNHEKVMSEKIIDLENDLDYIDSYTRQGNEEVNFSGDTQRQWWTSKCAKVN